MPKYWPDFNLDDFGCVQVLNIWCQKSNFSDFQRPTDTSYYICWTWNFSNDLILWKQKCLSLDQQYLWHLQDPYPRYYLERGAKAIRAQKGHFTPKTAIGPLLLLVCVVTMITSDPGGVINIADPVTGSFVFIKLGDLKNFMSNEGSMKCL